MNFDSDDIYYDNMWRVCQYENSYFVRHEAAWNNDGYTIIKEKLTWKEAEDFKKIIQKLYGR